MVRRINNALRRADQIAHSEGDGDDTYWMAPIIADAEAGFGGALNAYELMKAMIEAGAAGVHFEDQLASEKKCGHLGGKVLVPISQHIRTLNAARLAADVEGVPTVLLCRTDAQSAQLLTSDIDERDRPFIAGERTAEGFFRIRPGLGTRIRDRAQPRLCPLLRPPMVGDERARPRRGRALCRGDPSRVPRQIAGLQLLAELQLAQKAGPEKLASFQHDIAQMGYRFQFVTLAGFHTLNLAMFQLARDYCERGMAAYSEVQQAEFAADADGYTATRHQREVGVGYFDAVAVAISGGHPRRRRWPAVPKRRNSARIRGQISHSTAMTKVWCTTTTGRCTIGRPDDRGSSFAGR